MMTINELKNECSKVFALANLEFKDIQVKINGRLTRTHGRCMYQVNCGVVVPTTIEFSKQLLETATPYSIMEVLKHECAHAIACLETGEKQGHNNYFKAVCHKIGAAYNTCTADVERTVEKNEIYKYTVICKSCCQILGYYHRAGKIVQNPERYTCKCGGKIGVIKNF